MLGIRNIAHFSPSKGTEVEAMGIKANTQKMQYKEQGIIYKIQLQLNYWRGVYFSLGASEEDEKGWIKVEKLWKYMKEH